MEQSLGKRTIRLQFFSIPHTIWWNNCLHFGMRGGEEHHSLSIEHFHLEIDENGRHYILYTEGLAKTGNKGLNFKVADMVNLKLVFMD